MGFSPFTYWQRGKKTKQPLTRPKKGDSRPLILQMIEHGNFDTSPWENMIGEEYEMLEQDVEDYMDKNPDPRLKPLETSEEIASGSIANVSKNSARLI